MKTPAKKTAMKKKAVKKVAKKKATLKNVVDERGKAITVTHPGNSDSWDVGGMTCNPPTPEERIKNLEHHIADLQKGFSKNALVKLDRFKRDRDNILRNLQNLQQEVDEHEEALKEVNKQIELVTFEIKQHI